MKKITTKKYWGFGMEARRMRTIISLLLLMPFFSACASGPSKEELDAEVKRLCAIDGGVRVYETVKLPPDKFNQWGQINFYRPDRGENALGTEYLFKRETLYYKQGNPDFFRLYTQVFRRSDGKLLGESVFYKRGGGDLPGPWHGTSFICPELSVKTDVLRQIFVIDNKEQ